MVNLREFLVRVEAEIERHRDRYSDLDSYQLMVELRYTMKGLETHRPDAPDGATFVFLDFDGVMNDHRRLPNGYAPLMAEQIALLNILLDLDQSILIVLSSAWRASFPTTLAVESLLGCHGVHSKDRIHGVTELDPELWHPNHPEAQNQAYWSERGLIWRKGQVERYMSRYPGVPYVVVDDLPLDITPDRFVQTDATTGLTIENVMRVINLLAMQVIVNGQEAEPRFI